MANEWSKIRRYLRELLQEWCPGGPSKFLRCCVVVLLFWMLVLMMCWFFPIKTPEFLKNCQPKNTGILFSYITICQMFFFVQWNGGDFWWISLSLTHGNSTSLLAFKLDFSNACAVLRRHPLFEICKELQQTSITWNRSFYQKNPEKDTKNLHVQTKVLFWKEAFHMVDDEKTSSQSQWCKNKVPSKSLGEYKNHTLHASEMEPTSW